MNLRVADAIGGQDGRGRASATVVAPPGSSGEGGGGGGVETLVGKFGEKIKGVYLSFPDRKYRPSCSTSSSRQPGTQSCHLERASWRGRTTTTHAALTLSHRRTATPGSSPEPNPAATTRVFAIQFTLNASQPSSPTDQPTNPAQPFYKHHPPPPNDELSSRPTASDKSIPLYHPLPPIRPSKYVLAPETRSVDGRHVKNHHDVGMCRFV